MKTLIYQFRKFHLIWLNRCRSFCIINLIKREIQACDRVWKRFEYCMPAGIINSQKTFWGFKREQRAIEFSISHRNIDMWANYIVINTILIEKQNKEKTFARYLFKTTSSFAELTERQFNRVDNHSLGAWRLQKMTRLLKYWYSLIFMCTTQMTFVIENASCHGRFEARVVLNHLNLRTSTALRLRRFCATLNSFNCSGRFTWKAKLGYLLM